MCSEFVQTIEITEKNHLNIAKGQRVSTRYLEKSKTLFNKCCLKLSICKATCQQSKCNWSTVTECLPLLIERTLKTWMHFWQFSKLATEWVACRKLLARFLLLKLGEWVSGSICFSRTKGPMRTDGVQVGVTSERCQIDQRGKNGISYQGRVFSISSLLINKISFHLFNFLLNFSCTNFLHKACSIQTHH